MAEVYNRGTHRNILTFYNVFFGVCNVLTLDFGGMVIHLTECQMKPNFTMRARGYCMVYVGGLSVVVYLTEC